MNISQLSINLINPQAGLIGFASFVLEDSFYVSGIAIHEKRDGSGYRLTYPTRRSGVVVFNLFHPTDKKTSASIESAIFQKLKDVLNQESIHAGHHSH